MTPPSMHVRCDPHGDWTVTRRDAGVVSRHGSATEAEQAAVAHAEANGIDRIVLHDRYENLHVVRTGAGRTG